MTEQNRRRHDTMRGVEIAIVRCIVRCIDRVVAMYGIQKKERNRTNEQTEEGLREQRVCVQAGMTWHDMTWHGVECITIGSTAVCIGSAILCVAMDGFCVVCVVLTPELRLRLHSFVHLLRSVLFPPSRIDVFFLHRLVSSHRIAFLIVCFGCTLHNTTRHVNLPYDRRFVSVSFRLVPEV